MRTITDAELEAARRRGESPAEYANRVGGMGSYRFDPMERFIAKHTDTAGKSRPVDWKALADVEI